MYRYSVDNAVTYTAQDIVLFRESPFASWMERLTLENPGHGIPPDIGSVPLHDGIECQDELAETLHAENKDVCLIDWQLEEPGRRSATLGAMRAGVDFIVNGQLALGPLSGAANLLVRTSGYSELGDFLYIPCDTQAGNTPHVAFRLCFLADLLHSLQGQLAPQMLIVREGGDLVPLQTESHIYHFRAVKQRFLEAMRDFHEHHMPDPAESSHFGRWSDCANEVLRQQLWREEEQAGDTAGEEYGESLQQQSIAHVASGVETPYDLDAIEPAAAVETPLAAAPASVAGGDPRPHTGAPAGLTLVEQARLLEPAANKGSPGVSRPESPQPSAPTGPEMPRHNRRASDSALQNLEFIGSGLQPGRTDGAGTDKLPPIDETAPAPSLRGPRSRRPSRAGPVEPPSIGPIPGGESRGPDTAGWLVRTPQSDDGGPGVVPQPAVGSAIDLDGGHMPPPSRLPTAGAELLPEPGIEPLEYPGPGEEARPARTRPPGDRLFSDPDHAEAEPRGSSFSSSLITNENLDN